MPASTKVLKGGDLGFGSLLFLRKALPSPRFKLNMFVDYDVATGRIRYTEEMKETLKLLGDMLQGVKPDQSLADLELGSGEVSDRDLL